MVWLIGIYAIMFGMILVALGVAMRRLRREDVTPGTGHPAPA